MSDEASKPVHGQWSSRLAFILAATGSAVGLGNIWKFPYVTGENGGGAFVLVYLACIFLVGIPIMMAEVLIGRRGGYSPVNSMRRLAVGASRSPAWQAVGWMGIVAGFLILSFYSVIAGWTVSYVFRTGSGLFDGMTADAVASVFGNLVADAERQLAWHTVFMIMTGYVVARGVEQGLEKAVRWLMPSLFVLLVALVGYAMNSSHFDAGLRFLFEPDFSKIDGDAVVAAMGQAFFSLSLGMGAIMMYGSYLPKNTSIPRSVVTIALADTLVAVLAGLAIFPLVFANGLEPAQSVGLIFKTLPIAFGQMPGGALFGTLFFLLLVIAAWTSAISIMDPVVGWLVETRAMTRMKAAILTSGAAWFLGIGTILSFNHWAEITLFGKTFFDLADFTSSNVLLPLGGVLIAIFAAWGLAREMSADELDMDPNSTLYKAWHWLAGVVGPVAVLVVFLSLIGLVSF